MIVELKKTKITKNIFKQSFLGSSTLYYNLPVYYTILGYCVVDKLRYALLYNNNENQVIKLRYIRGITDVELFKQSVQLSDNNGGYIFPQKYHLKIYCIDFNTAPVILVQNTQTDDEILKYYENTKEFVNTVNQKGQIYL